MKDQKLWVLFSTETAKIVDLTPLLEAPAFVPLADEEIFRSVYIERGITVWNAGEVDIAPEYLYAHEMCIRDRCWPPPACRCWDSSP